MRLARGDGVVGSDEVGRGQEVLFLLNKVVLIVVLAAVVSEAGWCCYPDQTRRARKGDMTRRLDRHCGGKRGSCRGPQ